MPEYFQYLNKPDRVEDYVENYLGRVEERLPERAKINKFDAAYQELALKILREGKAEDDRTGTGTIKLFAENLRFDMSDGSFPLLTTKKVHKKSIVHELLWFIKGERNVKPLQEKGVTIWDEWADENGDLGPVYGYQWRHWRTKEGGEIDQLSQTVDKIRNKPHDRRLIVSAWNVGELNEMALPPCHLLYQFDVEPNRNSDKDYLNCQMYQRSADYLLGVPFNIASYAALLSMTAQVTDKIPKKLTIAFGNVHIYINHIRQVLTQLSRDPYPAPQLELNPAIKEIDDFEYEDIKLLNYQSHKSIKAPISV